MSDTDTVVDRLLARGQVAVLCKVTPITVTRWANTGKLAPVRTPGGHRRYSAAAVYALKASREAKR